MSRRRQQPSSSTPNNNAPGVDSSTNRPRGSISSDNDDDDDDDEDEDDNREDGNSISDPQGLDFDDIFGSSGTYPVSTTLSLANGGSSPSAFLEDQGFSSQPVPNLQNLTDLFTLPQDCSPYPSASENFSWTEESMITDDQPLQQPQQASTKESVYTKRLGPIPNFPGENAESAGVAFSQDGLLYPSTSPNLAWNEGSTIDEQLPQRESQRQHEQEQQSNYIAPSTPPTGGSQTMFSPGQSPAAAAARNTLILEEVQPETVNLVLNTLFSSRTNVKMRLYSTEQ